MQRILVLLFLLTSLSVTAATFEGDIADWKEQPKEKFKDPEKNFKLVLSKIKKEFIDRELTDEELYRAATAGVLAALNSGNDKWNLLLSPRMLEDFNILMTRKLTGIGATLKMDPDLGVLKILKLMPKSSGQLAGLQVDDIILSVNGQKCKGKKLPAIAELIRGPAGGNVNLKVLREDRVMNFNIARAAVEVPGVELQMVDAASALITIDQFSQGTASQLAGQLAHLSDAKIKRLVLDLRSNDGGDFEEAVKSIEQFLSSGTTIVNARYGDGSVKEFKAHQSPWRPDVKIVVLVSPQTSSGAELMSGALKDFRSAALVGSTTHGKWNGQVIESLSNGFAIKYSVMHFETGKGNSYQGRGLTPDLETQALKDGEINTIQMESDIQKRLGIDAGLRAALQIPTLG